MKRLIVDCSKPIGQQETIIDITDDEKETMLSVYAEDEATAPLQKPRTAEERIADLEEIVKTLTTK